MTPQWSGEVKSGVAYNGGEWQSPGLTGWVGKRLSSLGRGD